MIEHFLKKSQLLTRGKGDAPPQRSKFITKDESHLNSLENLNKTSIKINSQTGSRVGRISSYVESLRLFLISLLFTTNAYAQGTISPTAFIDLEYFYDGVGNITSITDRIDSQNSCTMQYDSLDRLINADGPWGVGSFTYDSVGNRTSKDIAGENINYSYGADNRLSGVVHDPNGNIIDDGVFTYTYDSENRLIQVTNGVDVITYEYDGDGRRIKRVTNDETTYYAYGVGLNVLTEFSGLRIPKHDYIYAGNKNIARVNYDGSGVKEGKTFYHSDHLGSNIAITDATSTVEWDRVYLPYGQGFNDPNVDFLQNTHEYTAKELDEDSGLYYYGARYYNPSIGRFMSVDSAGGDLTDPQSWNRYSYTLNNPYKYVDPNGEEHRAIYTGLNNPIKLEIALNNFIRGKLDFVPNLVLDIFLPVDPESIAAGFLPGPQVLGTGVISKEVGKSIFNRVTTKISSLPKPSRVPNAGGFIRSFLTKEDQIFFRVFSGDNKTGRFLTKVRPKNRQQAIEGLALPSGNEAEFIQEVLVPAGTRLQRSRALSAFGRRGGREQFELLNKIPDENFGPGVPFR